MEDTLALQLKRHVEARPGAQYANLVGDAVVGLASLSMTLVSRRRLAVNGTLESIGRLLARSMSIENSDGGGGGSGRKGRKGRREAIRNLVSPLFFYGRGLLLMYCTCTATRLRQQMREITNLRVRIESGEANVIEHEERKAKTCEVFQAPGGALQPPVDVAIRRTMERGTSLPRPSVALKKEGKKDRETR